ncbi:MAG TPA: nitroreductase/quinone reductase family protein [Actinomycetota bacterium]
MRAREEVRSPPKSTPWVNRAMSRLLRSPLSRLVDRGIVLLTVYGRNTGHPYTFPVQYVQQGEVLWVYVGHGEQKTWWRNLTDDGPVEVLLRKRLRTGRGLALAHDAAPEAVEEGLRRYADRFPGAARRLRIPTVDDETIARAAARTVIVRITLEE